MKKRYGKKSNGKRDTLKCGAKMPKSEQVMVMKNCFFAPQHDSSGLEFCVWCFGPYFHSL
jgi:Zn-finger protein